MRIIADSKKDYCLAELCTTSDTLCG